MILKHRDDTRSRIHGLKARLADPSLPAREHDAIEHDIRRRKAGEEGEGDAAHYMDVHYGRSRDWMVIHDLRIEHDGLSAQIDHLIIGRLLDVWVCETKRFGSGVKITEHGEFVTFVNRMPRGIDSPIEQNIRHIKILGEVLKSGAVALPRRLGFGLAPKLRSLVLISGGAINRPRADIAGIETVIKTDQLHATIGRTAEHGNPLDLLKLVSSATIEDIGRQLVALHRPVAPTRVTSPAAVTEDPRRAPNVIPIRRPAAIAGPDPAGGRARPHEGRCQSCAAPIGPAIIGYCRKYAERFAGRRLCRACQAGCPAIQPVFAGSGPGERR